MRRLPTLALWGLFRLVSIPVIAILLVFTARRLLFSLAIFFPQKEVKRPENGFIPETLILVPCRNEEKMLRSLCQSLSRLNYPSERYQIVLINDGSSDRTAEVMEQLTQDKPDWHVFSLSQNVGKASALNAALKHFPFGEIIYIFDADHRPEPDALLRAVQYFKDPCVAGVSGWIIPSNMLASPSAYYSGVESYVHQMVTMRAKDNLSLAPALLGSNCGYRRKLLFELGGFRDGALLEDSDLTLVFHRAGYRVRFAEDVIATHQVPETIQGYLNQHTRWSRGFMDVVNQPGSGVLRDQKLVIPLRIELFLFSMGYLDRIAIVGAIILCFFSSIKNSIFNFPRFVLSLALLTPFAQIFILFIEQRMPRSIWLRLPFIPIFYTLDILAAGIGVLNSVTRRRRIWTKTDRSSIPE